MIKLKQLLESDIDKDIDDLQNLLNHPDVEFADKEYGSVEKYQDMIKDKIASLKSKINDGPHMRIDPDDPLLGYGNPEYMEEEEINVDNDNDNGYSPDGIYEDKLKQGIKRMVREVIKEIGLGK